MKSSEAKFTRRYNIGQYEFEEYTLTAVVEDNDNVIDCLNQLKLNVAAAYAGETSEAEPEVEAEEPAPKARRKKAEPEPEVEEEEEEIEPEADEDEAEETEEETDEEPVPESKKFTGKEKPKKTFKKKPQVYQRDNETHKDLFAALLKGIAPDWKKSDAGKAKAKKASLEMEGEDFLDGEGEILPTFKTAVKKLMGKK